MVCDSSAIDPDCVCVALCRSTLSPRMLMELNLERSTWQLLYALYSDRVETEGQEDEMITDLLVCLERH